MTRTTTRQIELILHRIDDLPTLSPIATNVLRLAGADDTDFAEVARLIESDPALTARILSLCRSADRGLGDRVQTVQHAVGLLGLEAVQSAVLAVSVYELMNEHGHDVDVQTHARTRDVGPVFDRVGFWKHSIAVACASELVAHAHPQHRVRPDEAFVGGLLHDLGKLVLDLILPQSFARVIALCERRQQDSAASERAIIGIDHHTAGKRIAEHWELPSSLQDVMWLHGQETLPAHANKGLIAVVEIARTLCRELHLGFSGDFGTPPCLTSLCKTWGFDRLAVDGVVQSLHDRIAERCRILGLDEQTSPEILLQSLSNANRRLSRLNLMLDHRARLSQRQGEVLDALVTFHEDCRPGRGLVESFASVVRSAAGLVGAQFYGVLFQPDDEGPWHIHQFDADGHLLRSEVGEAPGPEHERAQSLRALTDASQLSIASLGLLPWLTDFCADAVELRDVRIMSLSTTNGRVQVGAALLYDADPGTLDLDAARATWAASIAAAADHEESQKLGEQLVESNRELASAQSRLTEAASMARLGEMTAGAAHEMNNPLTVIRGRAQMLIGRARDAQSQGAARAISQAAEELSNLVTSLHLLSDPPTPDIRTATIHDVIERSVAMARDRLDVVPEVRLAVNDTIPNVAVDTEMLAMALAELLVNAYDASPGTSIDLTVALEPLEDRLEITVADQGPGLSPKAIRHAFDPFFSEKPAGRQTGLGLARARAIVELHDGEIMLVSRDGTEATISLRTWRGARQAA